MHTAIRISVTAVLIAAAATAQAQSGAAATTPQVGLEEIVVTAQRRSEQLQEVPVAVSAFSEKQMEQLNITSALDVGQYVPNMMAHNNTGLGTANAYTLRGLGNTESIATFDPPVGTYVDDVFIARQNGNNFAFFDVDRIEVLRGPQGTLFGRNTTGGAVNIILKKPAEEFGGFAEAGFGEWDKQMLRGSVDIPLSDKVLTKFSAFWMSDNGYVKNLSTKENDLNSNANIGARAAVRWLITDAITWDFAVDYMDTSALGIVNFEGSGGGRISHTGITQNGYPFRGLVTGSKQNLNLGNDVRSTSFTSDFAIDTAIGTLNFITGYRDMRQEFAIDFFDFNRPFGGFTIVNDGSHDQFSQEVKLSGDIGSNINYVTGLFYFKEDNKTDFADIFAGDLVAPSLAGIPLILADRVLDNTTEAFAVYGQADWTFADAWTLTAGLRFTDESKDVEWTANDNPRWAGRTSFGKKDSQSTSQWTPRVALKYDFNPDVNVYASVTQGFKSGGWNARGTSNAALLPFGPEEVTSYEIGLRSQWFDNRLRLNVTGFRSDTTDFQLPAGYKDPVSGAITFVTGNYADLLVDGVEVELVAAPVDGLTIFANIGLMDAQYENLDQSVQDQLAACQTGIAGGVAIAADVAAYFLLAEDDQTKVDQRANVVLQALRERP